jgi:hypothetical protein
MLKSLVTAAALAAVFGAAGEAHAEVQKIWSSGYWGVSAGMSEGGGAAQPLCVMSTSGATVGFEFMLKVNRNNVYFQLMNPAWNIPKGQTVKVRMMVDSVPLNWTMESASDGGDNIGRRMLTGNIPLTDHTPGELWPLYVSNLLHDGKTLTVEFPDGNAQGWTLNLTGSADAIEKFWSCAAAINKDGKSSCGQPFSRSGDGQPYAVTPKYEYQ